MKTKLQQFKERNRKRNAHLYIDGLIEGYDYVVCPISKERMSMIKKSYITNVLGITEDEYPNIQRVCLKRKENIKSGLKQIDLETGLTKHELSVEKAKEVLSEIGKDGMSGYDRKGKKTRATHMANIDELGRHGYRRQADARLTTLLPNGLTVEENAHQKQKESMLKNHSTGSGGASKISKKVLAPVITLLEANNLKYYFDKQEYGIKDADTGNYYFYDLTIPELHIAIEYQSAAWHSNPVWKDSVWQQWAPPKGKRKTANESLEYDYNKARSLYKHRNIVTHYVWEDTVDADVERILCLLKM